MRGTVIVHGRLATRELRLAAARTRSHGLQIMAFEQLATRLAGGLSEAVDTETLRSAIQTCLPDTELGELDPIKSLPGMVGAAAETLRKVWRAGIDLQARADVHPRIASMAGLEKAVLNALPPSMMRPADLVAAGMKHLDHAKALFGSVEILGITELSPCWRPLLLALSERIPVKWNAGPRSIPRWLNPERIEIVCAEPEVPELMCVSAATAQHEAIEALRWARELVVSGQANPSDIAIASATTSDYDDHLLLCVPTPISISISFMA